MSDDHTPDEELYGALRWALRDEPPMTALPHEDLARGRRRLLHRRLGTAAGVAAVVPAVALVATVVPDGLAADPGSPGFADPPSDSNTAEAECVGTLIGDPQPLVKPSGRFGGPPALRGTGWGNVKPVEPAAPGARLLVEGRARLERTPVQSGGEIVVAGSVAAGNVDGDCEAVEGAAIDMPELDRLERALTETLDPSSQHLTGFLAGAGVSATTESGSEPEPAELSQASITGEWAEGGRAGSVSLAVSDATAAQLGTGSPAGAPCEDPGLIPGPRLTCERRELADGTVVLVGTGSKDGFERITVRYVRDDGQVVWATADQASSMWWEDGTGADPLDAPPATVDQLVELAQDQRVHL